MCRNSLTIAVPSSDEHPLEAADVGVPLAPHRRRHQLLDAHDEHVLVVAAVEHADLALGGRVAMDPPQEVVTELLRRGHAEGVDPDAGRVEPREHLAQHAVLAACVHRLQHHENGPRRLGVEHLLQLGEALAFDVQLGLRRLLGPAERLAGIVLGEVEIVADAHPLEQSACRGDWLAPACHRPTVIFAP